MGQCYFSIQDEIVRDSIKGLSILEQPPVIVGGLGIQYHARDRKENLRGTSDADLLSLENLSFEQFRDDIYPKVAPSFTKQGYCIQPKRGRGNHALKVMKRPNHIDEQIFLVHWTHFSPDHYTNFLDYIKQQLSYSSPLSGEFQSQTSENLIKVAALEELVPLKAKRFLHYNLNNSSLEGVSPFQIIEDASQANWGRLASIPLGPLRSQIEGIQDELGGHGPYTPERFERYKQVKDGYDLFLAARVISDHSSSFDKARYQENFKRILGH